MDMIKALEGDPINELTELQAKFFLMKALEITADVSYMASLRADVCKTITSNVEFKMALKEALKEVSGQPKRGIEDGKA